MSQAPDVVVVGGGPVGCVTAASFAVRGARVTVLEANPGRKARFAGELIHPPAVRVLQDIGFAPADHVHQVQPCQGFAVFGHGADGIVLPYNQGHGVSFEHQALVEGLREHVKNLDGVTWLDNARGKAIDGQTLSYKGPDGEGSVTAPLIVGADGKFSAVRTMLGIPREKVPLSYMAGLVLRDVELPHEGFGHVLLGGLGPALAYRIEDDGIRICLDVPASVRAADDCLQQVWEGYRHSLPKVLGRAIQAELEAGRVLWAVNAVHARSHYGRPGAVLVGDAVGHYHPMTAAGMVLGFADAQALAQADGAFKAYSTRRARECHVPTLLATALYEIFALDTEPTIACREAVFELWRRKPEMRSRTMDLLAAEEVGMTSLLSAGVPMMLGAAARVSRNSARTRSPLRGIDSARRIAGLLQWLAWESVPRQLQFKALRKPTASPFQKLRVEVHSQAASEPAS